MRLPSRADNRVGEVEPHSAGSLPELSRSPFPSSNVSVPRTGRDGGLSPALPSQLPGRWSLGAGGWRPARSAREGTSPHPCPACARGSGQHAARLPGRARSQRESHCVSDPRAFFPPARSLPFLPPARRAAGGHAPGSHKAWHPASDPSQPPHPGSLEGRAYRPHPELAAPPLLSQGFGMSKLEGPWAISQPGPLVHRRETGPQNFHLFLGLATASVAPGPEPGPPKATALRLAPQPS